MGEVAIPRTCTVCSHEESFAINEALILERASNRSIAKQYGVDHNAVQRHRRHIPELLVEASRAQQVADADALLDDIARIRQSALDLLDLAERSHEWKARVAAIREIRENARILGELHGKLSRGTTINLSLNPEWLKVEAVIVSTLDRFPPAREAVVAALQGLDLEESNGGH